MTPRINLLSPDLTVLRHLCNACPTNPNRHYNLEFVVVMPKASPLSSKNVATHRKPHIRDVAKDVIKHVS